jgi:hypothetical protein
VGTEAVDKNKGVKPLSDPSRLAGDSNWTSQGGGGSSRALGIPSPTGSSPFLGE